MAYYKYSDDNPHLFSNGNAIIMPYIYTKLKNEYHPSPKPANIRIRTPVTNNIAFLFLLGFIYFGSGELLLKS
ncbi:MAG: hypothetical protein WC321_07195 [Candidatus Omnitrophota bacterium]|jgi:hypothetical protein